MVWHVFLCIWRYSWWWLWWWCSNTFENDNLKASYGCLIRDYIIRRMVLSDGVFFSFSGSFLTLLKLCTHKENQIIDTYHEQRFEEEREQERKNREMLSSLFLNIRHVNIKTHSKICTHAFIVTMCDQICMLPLPSKYVHVVI